MPQSDSDTDTAWHRWFGRRLRTGEVGEDRARGAYLNGRIAWVLAVSMIAAILVLGGAFLLHGHGLT